MPRGRWRANIWLAVAAAVSGLATAAAFAGPARLMDWPDLLGRPLPQPSARIAYGPGATQFGELWLPDGPGLHPVVIMIHGGCWRAKVAKLTSMNYVAEDLRRRGLAVWNIEYRGADEAGGGYPGTYQDVAAAADKLRAVAGTRGLSLGRVIAVGHSAGGHLAAWLAARPKLPRASPLASPDPLPIAGVVNLGGVPDLKVDRARGEAVCGERVIDAMTGPPSAARSDVYADTSPAEMLPLGAMQLVINGANDPLATPELGRDYADRAKAAGDRVRQVIVPDTGHVELIAPGTLAWTREAELIVRMTR
jgi:acetyl esterase/lipase